MKYKNRVRSRISNLKDVKNPNLRRTVLCGSITPERMAKMTAEVRDRYSTQTFLFLHLCWSILMLLFFCRISSFKIKFLHLCFFFRKWQVMSWRKLERIWPKRLSGTTRWPPPEAPRLTYSPVANARERTAPTRRYRPPHLSDLAPLDMLRVARLKPTCMLHI